MQTGVNYEAPEYLFTSDEESASQSQDAPLNTPQYTGTIQGQIYQQKPPSALKHPICTAFHLIWKIGALLTYLFAYWLLSASYVVVFIVCIVFLSFDFWTVKNVSGRLMVGLRWWNEIKEDGSNEWIFESQEDQSQISSLEKVIFWSALFGAPALWLVFAVVSILKLNIQWLLIVLVALALSFANIVGYIKCAKDARKQVTSFAQSYIANAVIDSAFKK